MTDQSSEDRIDQLEKRVDALEVRHNSLLEATRELLDVLERDPLSGHGLQTAFLKLKSLR
ncbi:MAG: hypothetical protein MOGMAGMI_01846 [Candidatus Omnitrophica bacterium]|nr:hypothetical protein [Candidatus Omnitrophota bacterium]